MEKKKIEEKLRVFVENKFDLEKQKVVLNNYKVNKNKKNLLWVFQKKRKTKEMTNISHRKMEYYELSNMFIT